MITSNWNWSLFALGQDGVCPSVTVDETRHERISALLGPDGEPLRVGYERPRLGFDLTKRKAFP